MIEEKTKPAPRKRATVKKTAAKSKTVEKSEPTEIVANPVFIETADLDLIVMSNGTQLSKSDFFVTGDDVDKVLEDIKKEVSSYVQDTSTAKGRSEITKTVSIVTKCKTYLEAQGRELSAEYKLIPGKIDKNRTKVKEFLTNLQNEIRKPLTDWQEEQAKIKVEQEKKEAAEKLHAEIENCHELSLLLNEKFDRDLADENARLAQEKIDNDKRIAQEAAEKATIEAERLAQKAIDDAQAAKQKAIDDKAKSDGDLLESQARQKELEEHAAQTKLNNEWLAYISEAYSINDKLNFEAEQKRQSELAEQKRLDDIETARQEEVFRQQEVVRKANVETAKREANTKYLAKVHNVILACLLDEGFDVHEAKKFIKLAAQNKLPQLTINY